MKRRIWGKILGEYLGLTLGSLLAALGLVLFLVPNKIAAGGVSGLAIIFYYLFHLPVGLGIFLLNTPLFVLAFRQLGFRFGLRSFYGTVALSFFTDFLAPILPVLTQNTLLASIYGGVFTGVGIGLCFRCRGTTGGTDLAAQLLRRYLGASVGQALLLADGAVITLAGFVFSLELALYALIALFVSSRLIDVVQEGFGYAKVALIVSSQSGEITKRILSQLNRGATVFQGRGAYTNQTREIVLCVVARTEVSALKQLVSLIDPQAFVVVANVHEALGEGFREISTEL